MDYKSLSSNFMMAQTFLAGAGLLAPRVESAGPLANMKAYIIAIIAIGALGIAFLLAGLYLYLDSFMQPYQVCLIMGGVISATAMAILASRIFVLYMFQRKIKKSIKALYQDIKDILAEIIEEAEKPISDNPKITVVIALLAGFILSKRFLRD